MGITDLLDEIDKGRQYRPLVEKFEKPPATQIITDGSLSRPARGANDMKPSKESCPGSNVEPDKKQAVASARNNAGGSRPPTQPKKPQGTGPTRTPRTTSARADPLAKPNQNPGPSDRRTSTSTPDTSSSKPPVRKQQTKKTSGNPFPAKKRPATTKTASKSTTSAPASSSRAPVPSTKAQPKKQPPKATDEPAKSSNDSDSDDIDSLFGDSPLPGIQEKEPSKPARTVRSKGSVLSKIFKQTAREYQSRKRTQTQLREDAAQRAAEEKRDAEIAAERRAQAARNAKAAREAAERKREAEIVAEKKAQASKNVEAVRKAASTKQSRARLLANAAKRTSKEANEADNAARSLISPLLTPKVIPANKREDQDLGEVNINHNHPLSAFLAPSDAGMDPLKQGNYPIILSDALLGKASKETVSGIRYNHKPALSSETAPGQARLKRSAKDGSYNLGFDDNGDKYQYNGVRTAADGQYVLVFDPERKAFVLHQVDSMFNMNITKAPDTNIAKQVSPLEVKGAVLDKPAPKQKASTAASKNKETPAKNASAGRGRGGKAAQNKQNTATIPKSKPASPPRAEPTKRGRPSNAESEDEDDDDDDGGLTIEYPDGPPPERFKPTVNKYASPALALSRRFSEFAAAYNPDEEEDVDMTAEFESRFNEDADGEGGGYEDDDEGDEDDDMVDALALPSPINKPTTMARTNSYHENPLPPPDRFSFDDGSDMDDMEAEFENVEEAIPSNNNQVNAADGIDDAEIAAMEEELAKEMESDVSEEE
ncbi:RNA polymerase II transcription elongation factor-domain-containing protein [Sordaria brevicollis]|uniref:RNA polymerase II transcription elongation factor-domain-containing protein n=1 Tax=Sordaria brevicollis TaxID=83679 RepID=A0AAE0NWN5_SORBR|nr:RNA polymerase II transcription elongation factor-domain-containing protein [Sordaria brevicollis]